MKTTLVNLRLDDEAVAILDGMAGKALNRQAVARMLLIAAIEAIQENGGKIHLPPKFTVGGSVYTLNEPSPLKRK